MPRLKSRRAQPKSKSSKSGYKTGSRSKKRNENVKKSGKTTKNRGPSPDELEDKRELHRIHERQRHYSLNMAIRKLITALPSCELSEPETKHYVLKKTSEYIQFLEDKIAELCLAMDIDQTNESGELSFTAPLYTVIDGFKKEIPADTPVSMESIQELMATLKFKVDNSVTSLTIKKNSSKSKRGAKKATRCRKEDNLQVGEISNECLQGEDMKEEDVESLSVVNTQDSLLASGSTGMLCSESTIETDASRSSQMNLSSTSSSWGTGSLDDGSSSSKIADEESTQGSSSSSSSHDLPQGGDSLADLIRCDKGVKYIPSHLEASQKSGSRILNQWSQRSSLQQVVLPAPSFSCNQLFVPSIEKKGPIPFLFQRDGKKPYSQPDSTTFLPQQQGSCNLSGHTIVPAAANHVQLLTGGHCGQETQQAPIPLISKRKSFPQSSISRSTPAKNILNQNLLPDSDCSPTLGYISCTLSNCSSSEVVGPNQDGSCSVVNPFEAYHPQSSLFQPVKQTVEIILDVGSDLMMLKSLLGQETSAEKSKIDGFDLFRKVNIKRFQDGLPTLKSKEISRLIGQAWTEIPDNFKQLYRKRASAWNLQQKKLASFKSSLFDQ